MYVEVRIDTVVIIRDISSILGSIIQGNEEFDDDIAHRIGAGDEMETSIWCPMR